MLSSLSACGDVASQGDTTNNVSSNNPVSTDNSQHGISSCSQGSTFTCADNGPGECSQSLQCTNVDGSPVTLGGPEPIDCGLVHECPTPTPTPEPAPVV